MKLQLFPHNEKAYYAVENLLEETGKAAVIHPTGTGKTMIAFELVMEHPDKRVLWLSPSEYIYKTQLENLAKYISKPDNITFFTYSKLMLNEGVINELCPDYIILDEFHRCGAGEWGKSVRKLLTSYPKAKLLGLSATNIRYLDNRRDMADELFEGNIASEMTLGEAIVKGILPAPEYVVSLYSYREELEKLRKRNAECRNESLHKANEKLLEQLKRTLENATGLPEIFEKHMKKDGRYIVFCSDKSHMAEMIEMSDEWFGRVDKEPHIYGVYYDNPETSSEFAAFKEDTSHHLKLLYCIDMLNEGVHVKDIDGVILLRPTVSPILYLQQIGRSLSAGATKKPVIFDIVNNFDNLYSVDTLQREMEEAFKIIECSAWEKQKFRERFHISEEVQNCRKLFESIKKNLSVTWEMYYLKAKEYYETYGNLQIPKQYRTDNGLSLGAWIVTQRRVYSGKVAGNLTQEQIDKLDSIGMEWETRQVAGFQKGLKELTAYKAAHGNANVKAAYVTKDGFALGKWVSNIRLKNNKAELTKEQKDRLNEIGMIWDKAEYQWNLYYRAAAEYYLEKGCLDVPGGYITSDGLKLGAWISNQRANYAGTRKGAAPLKQEQIDKLSRIGMVWDNHYTARWEDCLELAKKFYEENGHLDVPSSYCVNGIELGKWIASVRQKRLNPASSGRSLTEDRIKQLDSIGMIWNKDSWEIRFRLATEYYRQHGDLQIPADFVTKEHIWLGKWVYEQRRSYRERTLSSERQFKLEQIGMNWK